MAVNLSPAEAQVKINQIDEEMADVRLLADRILDSTETMTASSWQGGKAKMFGRMMLQHHEDMHRVINLLQDAVDKGKEHIDAFTAHEG